MKDLAGRARDKKLKPEEFTGSTFTISNLGMFDVDRVHRDHQPAGERDPGRGRGAQGAGGGRTTTIRPGHRMKVTLSSDHRVIDGALAAQFLAEVRRLLENPISLFV